MSTMLRTLDLGVGPEPADLLASLWPVNSEFMWLPGWGPEDCSILAIRPVRTQSWGSEFRMDDLRQFCAQCGVSFRSGDLYALAGPCAGGIFGALSYEASFGLDRLRNIRNVSSHLPVARFSYHPVVLVYDPAQQVWSLRGKLDVYPELVTQLRMDWQGAIGDTQTKQLVPALTSQFTPQVSAEEFGSWVVQARERIAQGDVYQANLAHPIRVQGSEPLPHLFARIHQGNPSPWACLWKTPEIILLSNSPELLLTLEGDKLVSQPIAGTRPRGLDNESDQRLRRNLLRSAKERAEHLMLVDLVRNDLGRICTPGSVQVPLLMDREPYRNVTHIVSTIQGRLDPAFDACDALAALFPGGTITGTPKLRSMECIDALETHARGYYTGSLGWINPCGDMAFNILIRTLQLHENAQGWTGELHVGAGIVADSNPAREYQETLHKAAAWKTVLSAIGSNG